LSAPLEQDHRFIKKRARPMQTLKSLNSALPVVESANAQAVSGPRASGV